MTCFLGIQVFVIEWESVLPFFLSTQGKEILPSNKSQKLSPKHPIIEFCKSECSSIPDLCMSLPRVCMQQERLPI